MNRLARVYVVQGQLMLANQLQYRAQNVLWMLLGVVQPLLSLVVWSTIARDNGGAVGAYSAGKFAAYFIVLMLVSQATMTWVIFGIGERVRTGYFSAMLLRPVHPIHADVAENLAFKVMSVLIYVPVTLLLIVVFHPVWHLGWETVLAIPAVCVGFMIRFTVEWTVGLLGFWLTQMGGVTSMYDALQLFLTGQIAPLTLFPGPIQVVAGVLPFRWMVFFPAELALNALSPRDVVVGFVVQALWVCVSLGAFRILWRRGIRQYSAVGS